MSHYNIDVRLSVRLYKFFTADCYVQCPDKLKLAVHRIPKQERKKQVPNPVLSNINIDIYENQTNLPQKSVYKLENWVSVICKIQSIAFS